MDLAILSELASFLEHHAPELAPFNPTGVIREFAATLWKELDFRNEASNTERFARQFENNENILTPRVHRRFTTGKVLTMDYITGTEVDQPGLLIKAGIDPAELSKEISRLIYEMIFTHGFFHADPHPGNITILPGGVVALYDYGMMGNCTPSFRASVATLVSGLAERDTRRVVRAIIEMSEEGFLQDPDPLVEDTHEFIAQHLNRPLKEINLSLVLNRLLEVLRKHRLRMKGSFYLGVKALSQIETVGRILNPSLNFIKIGEPYAMRTLTRRYQPKRMGVLFRRWIAETFEFLDEFPNDFRSAYHRLRKGKFSIPLEHKIDPDGFEPLRKTLDSIANRLTNAILTAAILICSGLIVHSRIPPRFHEISIIGLIGLIGGGFMAARIILSIWRHGGL
jgi:ubiquinone biosynthesis protein